jgi:hypothetical protein
MWWCHNGDRHEIWDGGRGKGAVGSGCEEWEVGFIKNMSGNVDSAGGNVKTLLPRMVFVVTDKGTRFGSKGKFSGVIGTKEWPTFTAKYL